MSNLEKFRNDIDLLDHQIINLLDQRFNLTNQVGLFKQKNNLDIENTNRELEIIKQINKLEIDNAKEVTEIYLHLFSVSKKGQEACKDLD